MSDYGEHAERWNYIQELLEEAQPTKDSADIKRKWICRIDNDKTHSHHWIFNIVVNKNRITKTFSDLKHGGKHSSLLACVAFRAKIIEEHNLVFMKGIRKQPFDSTKAGVSFGMRKDRVKGKLYEYPVWKCYWHEPDANGKQVRKGKLFYVHKHGFKRAKQKAVKFRKDKLKELYG